MMMIISFLIITFIMTRAFFRSLKDEKANTDDIFWLVIFVSNMGYIIGVGT